MVGSHGGAGGGVPSPELLKGPQAEKFRKESKRVHFNPCHGLDSRFPLLVAMVGINRVHLM